MLASLGLAKSTEASWIVSGEPLLSLLSSDSLQKCKKKSINFNKGQLFAIFSLPWVSFMCPHLCCFLGTVEFLWAVQMLLCWMAWPEVSCPVHAMAQLYLTSGRQIGILLAFSSLCSQQKEKPLEGNPGHQGTARRSWSLSIEWTGAHLVCAPSLGKQQQSREVMMKGV